MPETRKPKRQPPLHPSVEKVDELLAYILTLPARSSWHPYQEREFKARLFKTLASPDTGSTEKTRRKNHAPPWARAMVVILNLFQAEVPGAFDLPDPSTLEEPPRLPEDFFKPKETPLTMAIRDYHSRYRYEHAVPDPDTTASRSRKVTMAKPESDEWSRRTRRCEAPGCGTFFLDQSPTWHTRPRRTCSATCRKRLQRSGTSQ